MTREGGAEEGREGGREGQREGQREEEEEEDVWGQNADDEGRTERQKPKARTLSLNLLVCQSLLKPRGKLCLTALRADSALLELFAQLFNL